LHAFGKDRFRGECGITSPCFMTQTPNQALERTADRLENYKGEIRK
jgi:hypothetical protein